MFERSIRLSLSAVLIVTICGCSTSPRSSTLSPTTVSSQSIGTSTTGEATTTTTTESQLVASLLTEVDYPELVSAAQTALSTKPIHFVIETSISRTDVMNLTSYSFSADNAKQEISFLEGLSGDKRFNNLSIDPHRNGASVSVQLGPSGQTRRLIVLLSPDDPAPSWSGASSGQIIGSTYVRNDVSVVIVRSGVNDPFDLFGVSGAPGIEKGLDIGLCYSTVNVASSGSVQPSPAALEEVYCLPLGYALATRQHPGAVNNAVPQLEMFFARPVSVSQTEMDYGPAFNLGLYNAAPSSPAIS